MTRLSDKIKKVALTTGDATGIGLEVTAKALDILRPSIRKSKTLFFIFRPRTADLKQKKWLQHIDKKCLRLTFNCLDDALEFVSSLSTTSQIPDHTVIDLSLDTSPAVWVLQAALACHHELLDSMVTGPLSKAETSKLKGRPIGHTGIFRALFPKNPMFMAFIGSSFNVMIATDHISLNQVERMLQKNVFKTSLQASLYLRRLLNTDKKIAVLGLNPHAGEKNIIGSFETKNKKYISTSEFDGFLSPDAAFLKKNWARYSHYLALYHDQGLIPFKMHHGQDSGVHLTVGLPFIRTSVDHGTAEDIFNKNLANPNSMLDAITLNLKLIGGRHV